jgi:hypothetical protein
MYGNEMIERVSGDVYIIDKNNKNQIGTAYLTEVTNLALNDEGVLYAEWTPPEELPSGEYSTYAVIEYDGVKTNTSEYYFIYGDLLLEILDISPTTFDSGRISYVNAKIKSYWNEELTVTPKFEVLDKEGNLKVSDVSSPIKIKPLGTEEAKIFIDLTDIAPGEYTLKLILEYSDKKTEKSFPITVHLPSENEEAKETVKEKKEGENKSSTFLVVGVILLVIIIIIVIYFIWKKDQEDNDEEE